MKKMAEGQGLEKTSDKVQAEEQENAMAVPVDSQVTVKILENGKWAEITLSKPMFGGAAITKNAMQNALSEAGIVYGIKENVLTELVDQPVYDQPVMIAEGKAAVCGQDGYLRCLFDTDNSLIPIEAENGLVDYKNLNFVQNVAKGQVLAEIIPPTAAETGYDIFGNILSAEDGKPLTDPCGDNTQLSEDGKTIIASNAGSPKIKNQKQIIVSRVITVDNVDMSTGNLLYVGSIVVKGNVGDGFTVSASEGIVVKGTVENAKLISGGDITVGQGIRGLKSKVVVGGNLHSKFLENCIVEVKGDIFTEAILHADIKCHGKIVVSGRRGCIIGGACRAAHSITAQVMGNEKYIPTVVEVFGTFFLEEKMDELKKKQQTQQEEIAKVDKLLAKLDLTEKLQQTVPDKLREETCLTKEQHQKKLEQLEQEAKILQESIDNFGECKVSVERRLYENVMVIINDVKQENETIRDRCTAFVVDDQIIYC